MSNVITASNGDQVDLDNTPQTINYSGGFVSSIVATLTNPTRTYTQTFTNDGTNITHISNWIAS